MLNRHENSPVFENSRRSLRYSGMVLQAMDLKEKAWGSELILGENDQQFNNQPGNIYPFLSFIGHKEFGCPQVTIIALAPNRYVVRGWTHKAVSRTKADGTISNEYESSLVLNESLSGEKSFEHYWNRVKILAAKNVRV